MCILNAYIVPVSRYFHLSNSNECALHAPFTLFRTQIQISDVHSLKTICGCKWFSIPHRILNISIAFIHLADQWSKSSERCLWKRPLNNCVIVDEVYVAVGFSTLRWVLVCVTFMVRFAFNSISQTTLCTKNIRINAQLRSVKVHAWRVCLLECPNLFARDLLLIVPFAFGLWLFQGTNKKSTLHFIEMRKTHTIQQMRTKFTHSHTANSITFGFRFCG